PHLPDCTFHFTKSRSMEKIFAGKVALVTGGRFGIGRAAALAFARRGAKVVVADWLDDPDNQTAKEINAEGSEGIFVKCDVSNAEDINKLFNTIMTSYGRLDFAFNNAGIEGINAPTHECTDENWNKTLAINLTGVWRCMKHEITQMLKQGKGAIVNCASIAGLVGYSGLPAYVVSKHGIVGLTKSAALEYAQKGIRVNAVCPGAIKTPMIDRITGNKKEVEKQFEALEPIGRLGQPEEVAEAVIWLCSDQASFVTGHALTVDGGWTAA